MAPNPGPEPHDDSRASGLRGDPAVADLAALFLAELERRVDVMARAWDEADLEELARHARALRGAELAGFPQITTVAAALEEGLSRQADAAHVREQVEDLLLLCRRACRSAPEGS